MKMLVRAALLLSVVIAAPAHAAPVPRGATYGDEGWYQVGGVRVPASVRIDSSGNEISGGDASEATLDLINADTSDIKTNTAVIATLNTAFGAQADPAATSGAASFMSYTRAIRDALYDTTTASPVKISQSTTENDVDSNIGINAPVRIVSAAGVTEDETQVCAAACYVLRISGYNAAASTRYIKFTNLTAANTTPGTSTVYWSIPIPATSPFSIPVEQYFSTAATVYLVTGSADNDVAEVTAGDILGLAITTK